MRFIIFILVIGGCLLIFIYIKFISAFKKFNDYLFAINDKDTMRKIGGLDIMDQRRLAGIPFTKVHKALLEKYTETNNEQYLIFYRKYKKFSNLIIVITVILFFFYVFCQIIGQMIGDAD
jgi:hypothetical protein